MQRARRENKRNSILLIIEPDAATRSGMKRLLEIDGYKVTTVADEREAAAVAQQIIYNLILFDSNLPPPESFAAAYRLQASPEIKGIPLLVISVHEKSHFAPDDFDADRFSVAYLTNLSRFDEMEKLIDCILPLKKDEKQAKPF
ncbi:MAG: response regulator [Pyrinomonadaceae bacterium]